MVDADPRRVKLARTYRLKDRRDAAARRREPDAVLAGVAPPSPFDDNSPPSKTGPT